MDISGFIRRFQDGERTASAGGLFSSRSVWRGSSASTGVYRRGVIPPPGLPPSTTIQPHQALRTFSVTCRCDLLVNRQDCGTLPTGRLAEGKR